MPDYDATDLAEIEYSSLETFIEGDIGIKHGQLILLGFAHEGSDHR